MKNQYFADRRDLFKYDLLLDLVASLGSNRLTFIPMLTPDDASGEGRLTPSDERRRRESLYRFLRDCLDSGVRDIRKLRQLMSILGIEFMAYRDDAYFTDGRRTEYFDGIPHEYLAKSVIFFDPDVGLETGTPRYMRQRGADKYLLYSDLSRVWARTPKESVVVVYQHLQKDARKRSSDVERRLRDLQPWVGGASWAVRWNDLAFLVVTRDQQLTSKMQAAMKRYAERHDLAFHEAGAEPGPAGGHSLRSCP